MLLTEEQTDYGSPLVMISPEAALNRSDNTIDGHPRLWLCCGQHKRSSGDRTTALV